MCRYEEVYHVSATRGTLSCDRLTVSAVFWEQQGLQTFGQRIQITRPQASQPAFDRHFSQITEEYGPTHAINLLGSKDHEAALSSAYDRHLQAARSIFGEDVGITHFDFHASAKSAGWENVTRELRSVQDTR